MARSTFPSQKCQKTHGIRPLLEVELSKKCAPLWREAHFQVKSVKKPMVSNHFWKLRCRKSARRCGAKHISKSKVSKKPWYQTTFGSWDVEKVHAVVARSTFPSQKCQKNHGIRPLLEVELSKKCTPLWREAHFQVKSVKKTMVSDHSWKLRCRKSARRCGAKHISKSKW